MLLYRERNTFLQKLHPLTSLMVILLLITLILTLNNPIYLLMIIVSAVLLSAADGSIHDVCSFIKFTIPAALFIIILNPLLNHNGNTILFKTTPIPIMGRIYITMEALLYGVLMSVRLVGITFIFGFGNLIIHPDRIFAYFSKYMGNSALLMSMTLRLFPSLISSYNNIIDVEKSRGSNVNEGSFKEKLKKQGNIINILFLSCLENAADMSESMYSRGYGIGKRSVYFHEHFSRFDRLIIFTSFLIIVCFVFFEAKGLNSLRFYPLIDNPIKNISSFGLILCILFYIFPFLNWGCKIWRY